MSDEDIDVGGQAEEDSESSGGSPIKWIIIGCLVVLVVAGGIVGWLLYKKNAGDGPAAPESTVQTQSAQQQGSPYANIVPLEPFVVNLSDPGGKRYLKTRIELEFMSGLYQEELNARMPQLRDVILLLLSSKKMSEVQGIDGKIALRNELIMRINQVLKKSKIRNLYFTEFVIQ